MFVIAYDFSAKEGKYDPDRRKFNYELEKMLGDHDEIWREQKSVLIASDEDLAQGVKNLVNRYGGEIKIFEVKD